MSDLLHSIATGSEFVVKQRFEVAELFGFETRNKYEIYSDKTCIGFAAEQGKGLLAHVLRYFAGHWRTFEIHFFDTHRNLAFVGRHPFRWLFQRLEIFNAQGQHLGSIQQRFSILTKKFDVQDPSGQVVLEMRSPLFKIWTFPIFRDGHQVAVIKKRWTGIGSEMFTDKDSFRVNFENPSVDLSQRILLLAASIFIDLQYFEKKAG